MKSNAHTYDGLTVVFWDMTPYIVVHGDQKLPVNLTITVQHAADELKMAITEYTRNVDRAVLNTVFKNTVQCVNKCLETGGGTF